MPTNQGPVWQHSNPFTHHNTKAFKSQCSSNTGILWTSPQAKEDFYCDLCWRSSIKSTV